MKITMYELLGLIKDGKAPKKIKFCGNIYEWEDDWYLTKEKNYKVCLGGKKEEHNILITAFNEEVEIIEEPKKIEKLPYYSLEKIQKSKNKDEWYENRVELLEKKVDGKVYIENDISGDYMIDTKMYEEECGGDLYMTCEDLEYYWYNDRKFLDK